MLPAPATLTDEAWLAEALRHTFSGFVPEFWPPEKCPGAAQVFGIRAGADFRLPFTLADF